MELVYFGFPKMKKGQIAINSQLVMIILIVVAIYFGLQYGLLGTITGPGISNEKFSGEFDGIQFQGETAFLGEQVSSSRLGFCNDNDGDVKILNSFSGGQNLQIKSQSSTASGKNECEGNYIDVEFEVPAGDLQAIVNLNAYGPDDESYSELRITADGKQLFSERARNKQDFRVEQGYISPINKVVEFSFDEQTKIKIETTQKKSATGSASNEATFNFKPKLNDDVSTTIEVEETPAEEEAPVTSQNTQRESFIDRFFSFFVDLVDSIFGIFT